jgi:hypothetical protein
MTYDVGSGQCRSPATKALKQEESPNMRSLKTALVVLAAGLLASCASGPTVSSDYNPATNFAQYHSFGFMATDRIVDPMVDARIKDGIAAALTAKGWTRNDQNPDVLVVTHVQLSEQTQLNTYNEGWGYGWRWGGGMSTTQVQKIPVGTVIVDLVDPKIKQMIWRGTASDTLKENATPEQKQTAVNNAMTQLFQNFPPGSASKSK